ncbi:tetratricopeptide repeat protein [Alkaliphilus hydrothermalis]|uniref:Tetratricopeptide (TPR) repeat protein n=1 Tax=Alkaliphilus hydrothermalis TaxID=1482730 RepID=A0ABS2NUY5_9FIRM|nr:tetratricopeptide repeat protein [Alkaliphilus hydrothermalis]MBM7616389.1 tetratricopeptide (TPR) repeat protein [Alkaliphilus hydrothermalis]
MEFLIDPHILKNTEDLSFVHLKEEANLSIKGYQIPSGGLDIPMITAELAENIKTKPENEVITVAGIIRGMAYTLGIDQHFKFKEEYIKFLRTVNDAIENYILFQAMQSAEDNKLLESLILIKSVLVLNPVNSQALLNYGVTLLKYREEGISSKKIAKVFKQEAKNKLEELLTIEDNPMAYYQLAYIYKDESQFRKSKLYAEKLLELEVDELVQVRVRHLLHELTDLVDYETGYEAILMGKADEGLPLLLDLEVKYPEWWNMIFFVGLGYRQLGQFSEAIQRFDKVLEIKGDAVDAIAELGICYSSLGDYQKAIESFQRALAVGGENSEILSNLSMIYMELGEYQEAGDYIKRSLELNPYDEITLACQTRLEELLG